ncbi:MAG: phosphatase PAP2 family protein [Sedimentisphaerales bacterium]|nr:phosphatase PAP2 family protein [Sedimentisphaerales bacterium]
MAHHDSPARPAVFWVNGVLFGSVVALLIASLVSWLRFDQDAISAVVRSQVNWDGSFWVDVFTRLGKAWLLVWLLLLWFVFSRRRRDVLTGLLALILIGVLVNPLKLGVGRTRPHAALKFQMTGQRDERLSRHLSFPSGDTAAAFAVAAALLPVVGWPLRALFLISSAAIGALRVTALAHYPSDVLAGAAIGLLAGWLAIRLMDKWGREDRALPFESWLVIAGVVGIPMVQCITEGPSELLLLLGTYGLLVPCIALAMKIDAAVRDRRWDH